MLSSPRDEILLEHWETRSAALASVTTDTPGLDDQCHRFKRGMDIVLAVAGLLLSLPLWLFIALAIQLDSPGPIVFRQQRVGRHGRLFWMYKFRTMVANFDPEGATETSAARRAGLTLKRRDDPRVTRVGRLLRRISLDELPQFINVLRGDMSLIGPRPEVPSVVEYYHGWQRRRLTVLPGMTGWWQVHGRSDRPLHLHIEDDLYYIDHYSPLLDFLILLKTPGAVIGGRGAY